MKSDNPFDKRNTMKSICCKHITAIIMLTLCCMFSAMTVSAAQGCRFFKNVFTSEMKEAKKKKKAQHAEDAASLGSQSLTSTDGANNGDDEASEFEEGTIVVTMDDPAHEWSQFDSKEGKAMLLKDGSFILESKSDQFSAITITELDLAPDTDLSIGLKLMAAPQEDKYVGLVFDYANNRNYKAFLVSKKTFKYIIVEGGETSEIKQGLVKTGKTIESITFNKLGDKIDVRVNGLDTTILKKVQISNMNLGVIVCGKYKANIFSLYFKEHISEDTEQSTTPD